MTQSIFEEVAKSAERMGGCDPLWLQENSTPAFATVEPSGVGIGDAGPDERGALPELLLLHGLFGALSNWDSTLPLFARFARPIALSFPLLGAHRSEVKIKALAAYTEFFVRQQSLQPVTICGNSLGGHVALRLCLARPELVDCLVLAGSSGLYEHSVDSLPVRPDKRFVREHMSRVFCQQRFVTEEAIDEIYQILRQRKNVLNLIHAARSAKKDNLEDLLGQISCPTLLLWGEDDTVTSMEVAETFHRLIPRSTLVTVKNCGHAPMIEHPEWFSAEVEKFLRQHSRYFRA